MSSADLRQMYTFNKFNTDIVVVCCVWALTTVRVILKIIMNVDK